jgi:hypothetical protein
MLLMHCRFTIPTGTKSLQEVQEHLAVFMENQEKLGVRSEGVRGMHEAFMLLQDFILAGPSVTGGGLLGITTCECHLLVKHANHADLLFVADAG